MAARKKKSAKKASRKPVRKPAKKKTARTPRRKPETLRLRSVSVGLTVSDVQRSLAFYRDMLGFTLGETWKEGDTLLGAELKAGDEAIWIGQDDWAKGRDRVKGVGLRCYFTTVQPVDAIAERFTSKGGILDHGPADQPWGVRDIGLTDPDGFKLTIQNDRRR